MVTYKNKIKVKYFKKKIKKKKKPAVCFNLFPHQKKSKQPLMSLSGTYRRTLASLAQFCNRPSENTPTTGNCCQQAGAPLPNSAGDFDEGGGVAAEAKREEKSGKLPAS